MNEYSIQVDVYIWLYGIPCADKGLLSLPASSVCIGFDGGIRPPAFLADK